MKFDENQLILSGADSSPADMGDSCAETSRYAHLLQKLNTELPMDLNAFRTESGYVRHPSPLLPVDWRESDFSSDQALPLYLAMRNTRYGFGADEMKRRIREAGWKTGNGDYVSPMFFALLVDSKLLINLTVAAQALMFSIPFRWSDSKKRFESTNDSSGDYLNWFHASLYASPWIRKLVSKETLWAKITHYYRNEPDNTELLDSYRKVLERNYS